MKCEYCDNKGEYLITKIMQPSYPHVACSKCKNKQGFMTIKKLEEEALKVVKEAI
jgi:hypothetical protein